MHPEKPSGLSAMERNGKLETLENISISGTIKDINAKGIPASTKYRIFLFNDEYSIPGFAERE